jgi:hypothetical protein
LYFQEEVWEASNRVKANKGAAGVDERSIEDFESPSRSRGVFAGGLAQVRSRYIIPTTMDIVDPTAEWRRLSEHYRRMSDNELLVLARQKSELTEAAQQALADEVCQRGPKLQPEKLSAPPDPEPQPDSPYAEDRELIEICTVWSFPDALQLQMLLDRAGIPFFMGPEKARGVDAVT